MSAEPRDSDLVERAQAGDRAALGRLLERHRPLAARLAERLLGDPAEADDAAQEACLQAFLGLERLRRPERFGAWLAGIALNVARMRLRARRTLPLPEDEAGGRAVRDFGWDELTPSAEALAEVRALHRAVRAAIAALPPELQAAVRGHYLEGLSVGELAALAGAPPGTIKARLHRARGRLRAQLSDLRSSRGKEPTGMPEMIIHEVLMRVPRPADGQPADVLRLYGRPPEAGTPPETFNLPVPPPPAGDVLEAAGREPPPPGAAPRWVRLPDPPPPQFVVVLKERAGGRVLPIWIGPHEAQLIKWQLAGGAAPRPLTYEVMARLLAAAGARVERVTVSRLEAEIFYATIQLAAPADPAEVDARPSDALALAQRLPVPIFVAEAVLAQAGVAEPELIAHLDAETHRPAAPAGQPAGTVIEWQWLPAPAGPFGAPPPR